MEIHDEIKSQAARMAPWSRLRFEYTRVPDFVQFATVLEPFAYQLKAMHSLSDIVISEGIKMKRCFSCRKKLSKPIAFHPRIAMLPVHKECFKLAQQQFLTRAYRFDKWVMGKDGMPSKQAVRKTHKRMLKRCEG